MSELNYDHLGIAVYPNPAADVVSIVGRHTGENDVTVIDITGKQVFSAAVVNLPLHIKTTQLPAGNYFVRVRTPYGNRDIESDH